LWVSHLATLNPMKSNILRGRDKPTSSTCFRLYLQAELAGRCARNPRYSLRAFARYLGLDHATLSQFLRSKRRLTDQTIEKLGTRLGLEPEAIRSYIARDFEGTLFDQSPVTLRDIHQLTHDAASLVSDWYHYAILELVRLQDFKPDSRWIARVLGISLDEVNVALTRLVRFELLVMAEPGRWIDQSGDAVASLDDFTQVTIDRLAEQSRRLLLAAWHAAPTRLREHCSTTVAINTSRLPGILERIARFRQELISYLGQDETCDDVYQLEINLFPLTILKQMKETENGTAGDAMADHKQGAR
jgi:uncharacterized protein (TIGR02147 family)